MLRAPLAYGSAIQAASWGEFAIECVHPNAGEGRFEVPRTSSRWHRWRPHRAEFAIRSDNSRRLVMRQGDVYMMPADLAHGAAWDVAEFVLLLLAPDLIAESAAELAGGSSVGIVPLLKLRTRSVEHILLALKHEAETGRWGGRPYAEALGTALCVRMIKLAADLPRAPPAAGRSRASHRRLHRRVHHGEPHGRISP